MIKKCIECGNDFEATGKTKICSKECRKKRDYARLKKWLRNPENKKRFGEMMRVSNRERFKKMSVWARENGLCPKCYKRKPLVNYSQCEHCVKIGRLRKQRKTEEERKIKENMKCKCSHCDFKGTFKEVSEHIRTIHASSIDSADEMKGGNETI